MWQKQALAENFWGLEANNYPFTFTSAIARIDLLTFFYKVFSSTPTSRVAIVREIKELPPPSPSPNIAGEQ